MAEWKEQFKVVDGKNKARQKCLKCGVVLDVRAGRAGKHMLVGCAPSTPSELASPPTQDSPKISKYAEGSREWAIDLVVDIAAQDEATPEQKLKALDLLKDYEKFEGAAKFDDRVEVEKHLAQWDRACKRSQSLRADLMRLLKDDITRFDLVRMMGEVK